MKDNRDPEKLGTAMLKMSGEHPHLKLHQVADRWFKFKSQPVASNNSYIASNHAYKTTVF